MRTDVDVPLKSIVYVSTAVGAASDGQLEALLITARERNMELDVTGVLLHSEGTFMQCFEGSPAATDDVYGRIKASRQHRDIRELMNGPIERRNFSSWRMGLAQPTQSELLSLWTANWEHEALWSQGWKASPGMQMLLQFWSRTVGLA